jgi:hypothetical protein
MNPNLLQLGLLIGAAGQCAIGLLNFTFERTLGWEADIQRMPLLLREVHQIHAWFISIILFIFGAFTWRFAGELAAGAPPIGRWMACSIGLFWLIRTVMQVTHYSASHWRGNRGRTVIHFVLLTAYSALVGVYFTAGLR